MCQLKSFGADVLTIGDTLRTRLMSVQSLLCSLLTTGVAFSLSTPLCVCVAAATTAYELWLHGILPLGRDWAEKWLEGLPVSTNLLLTRRFPAAFYWYFRRNLSVVGNQK